MSEDRPKCRYCGEPTTARSHGAACCWCRLVEDAAPRQEGCDDCATAARRLAPIKERYRTAIEATRENCIAVIHEGLKQPLEAMPKILRQNFRQQPETALHACLYAAAENLTIAIRARVKAP